MLEPERIVTLLEWREDFVSGVVLSERDRRLAATLEGLEIREMRDGVYLKASSWVGIVRFEAFTVRILPKLANVDIVRMLLVTSGLDRLKRYQSTRDYQLDDESSLFDLVALLLTDACETVTRDGLLHGYVVEEDDLPVLRGRLLVAEQIRRRYGQVNRLECRFDDHHANIVENQILHTALILCRRYVRNSGLRRRVQNLADTFAAACGPLPGDWREVRAGLTYDRLNTHYQEAHQLAWIVMDGLGVRDILAAGHAHGFAFLLDMNPLFEKFITVLMQAVLHGDDFTIQAQAKSGGHIWDVARDRSYTQIIPDLLVQRSSGERLAIDAKYKRYDEHQLTPADIYQVFLYAYAFRDPSAKLPSALLLYPADAGYSKYTRLHIRDGHGYPQARLHAFGVDVQRALNELIDKSDKGTFEHIHEVVLNLLQ